MIRLTTVAKSGFDKKVATILATFCGQRHGINIDPAWVRSWDVIQTLGNSTSVVAELSIMVPGGQEPTLYEWKLGDAEVEIVSSYIRGGRSQGPAKGVTQLPKRFTPYEWELDLATQEPSQPSNNYERTKISPLGSTVTLVNMPKMTVGVVRETNTSLVYKCSYDDESQLYPAMYTCKHVRSKVADTVDTGWASHLLVKAKRPSDNRIQIGVPVFGNVVHRMELTYLEIPSWDGEIQRRIKVIPNLWSDPEYNRFFDADDPTDVGQILATQVRLFEDQTLRDPSALSVRESVLDFVPVPRVGMHVSNTLPCTRTHNFGTTKRLHDWLMGVDLNDLRSVDSDLFYCIIQDRINAQVFTQLTYGLCYICYRNSEPLFSITEI